MTWKIESMQMWMMLMCNKGIVFHISLLVQSGRCLSDRSITILLNIL